MSIVEKFMTMEYGPAPEDPREALAWLDRYARRFGHFINGGWQTPAAGNHFGTGEPFPGGKIPTGAPRMLSGLNHAVETAPGVFPAWRAPSSHARARLIYLRARPR